MSLEYKATDGSDPERFVKDNHCKCEMALTQGIARIGLPMKKDSVRMNLKTEVEKKNRKEDVEVFVGVVGLPGSGRKTLAYRFGNMHLPVIEDGEVPVQYFYTAILPGFFSRPQESYTVRLMSYIIEPPLELPVRQPPLYWERWNDFSCLIFVFDIGSLVSFHEASIRLSLYRQANIILPKCFLVGNKSDRRQDPPPEEEDPDEPAYNLLSEYTIWLETQNLGVTYHEVSARDRTNVNTLIFKIVE